jgi:hypothetical protein
MASIEKKRVSFKEDFPDCTKSLNCDPDKLSRISNAWSNSGSSKSVVEFLKKYLLPTHTTFEKTRDVLNVDISLEKTFERVYTARSKYVHEGTPMIISKFSLSIEPYEINLGEVRDRKMILPTEILPLVSYFDEIVHLTLKCYVNRIS